MQVAVAGRSAPEAAEPPDGAISRAALVGGAAVRARRNGSSGVAGSAGFGRVVIVLGGDPRLGPIRGGNRDGRGLGCDDRGWLGGPLDRPLDRWWHDRNHRRWALEDDRLGQLGAELVDLVGLPGLEQGHRERCPGASLRLPEGGLAGNMGGSANGPAASRSGASSGAGGSAASSTVGSGEMGGQGSGACRSAGRRALRDAFRLGDGNGGRGGSLLGGRRQRFSPRGRRCRSGRDDEVLLRDPIRLGGVGAVARSGEDRLFRLHGFRLGG